MFKSARKRMRSIAVIGVAAALVVGGVAAAQGGSGESKSGSQDESQAGKKFDGHFGGGPPPGGMGMKGLTYAELHVQKEGKAETIRLDQGKITAVDDSSITVSENDGNEVTIPVDADTQVIGKPDMTLSGNAGEAPKRPAKPAESSLADLEVGDQVTVSAPAGGSAESIMVMPSRAEMAKAFKGGPMPPPPGAPGSGN